MLREKDPSDYNGWESHVASHISPPSSAFMPRNHALSLKEHEERKKAEEKKQSEQAERTALAVESSALNV